MCVCVCVWVWVRSVVSNSCNPVACTSPSYPVHGISQARKQKRVAISFSRGIFPTPGSNWNLLYLLHWQADSLPLSHLGSPLIPQPGLKPRPPALRAQSLGHRTTREVPRNLMDLCQFPVTAVHTFPHPWWLKIIGLYSSTVREAKSQKFISLGHNQGVSWAVFPPEIVVKIHAVTLPVPGGCCALLAAFLQPRCLSLSSVSNAPLLLLHKDTCGCI